MRRRRKGRDVVHMGHVRYSVRPRHAFAPQELLDARTPVESSPTALLDTTVWEVGLVVYGAVVDVYGTVYFFMI